MEPGLVDTQGYPIGSLYYMVRAYAEATGDDIRSLDFKSRRLMFRHLGVPECRIASVSSQLLLTPFSPERIGLPTDYDVGVNFPERLS